MGFLSDKTIQVVDPEKVVAGHLVTVEIYVSGDDGELELSNRVNGIIQYVYEEYFSILTISRNSFEVSVEDILKGKYKVLGIQSALGCSHV